ncbi:MAG: DUF4260 domain-containing protein [Flavobacteriaceae bacterium]|nr:DUF4260 domain-containing protein [Flavobacteriaceae bacterium]
MKYLLKIEESAQFLLGIYLFSLTEYAWWWFPLLILSPDISIVGYLFNTKTGTVLYNIFHHKGLALGVYFLGIYLPFSGLALAGIILFSHSCMDRIMGYGLKYYKGFVYTHLGIIKGNA